jgi:hypothetical protein
MDNKTFLNELELKRNLQSAIRHLKIVAVRLFELEDKVSEIQNHLGMTDEKRTEETAADI